MQAIVLTSYGSTDNFRLEHLPLPPLLPGDVRIQIKSISFNPVDYQVRRGGPESTMVKSPILGRDLSGIVDAVHEDVAGFQRGDEVYCCVCNLASNGTYAEYVSVPAELVAKKPSCLSHDQAAAVPVAGITASLALEKVSADASKSMFIAGAAGGVGTLAIMLARQMGIGRLVATAGSTTSRAYLIEQCGMAPADIVDYRDDDFIEQSMVRNDGAFDCVLDHVGGAMLSACCQLLAVDGHLASITDAPSQADFEHLFYRNASFHAVGGNAYSLMANRIHWKKYQDILRNLAQLFDRGELRPFQVTNVGSFSVETVRRAHAMLEQSLVQGKLVMSAP